jgi:hypothetical protein
MADTTVVGRLQVDLPYGPDEARKRLVKIFPDEPSAFQSSQFNSRIKTRSPKYVLTHQDPWKGYLVIVHDLGQVEGGMEATSFGVELEPATGTSARAAAEDFWTRLLRAHDVCNGKHRPKLSAAEITCNGSGQEVLHGRVASVGSLIGTSQDLQYTVTGAVVGTVLLIVALALVTEAQRPTALWSVLPLTTTVVAAVIVVALVLRQKAILWQIR